MNIKANIGNIDYDNIIKSALPILQEHKDSKIIGIISGIMNMPDNLAIKIISSIPQETKDQLVAYIINHKKEAIIGIIEESLSKRGFPLEIINLEIITD